MQPEQNYGTHRRFHPWFHFFAVPVLTINVLVQIYFCYREPGWASAFGIIVALALVTSLVLGRFYALRVQDRVIRLEERLRLQALLPDELRPRIDELRMRHFIALRFCSDEELPEAARAVLTGDAKSADEIKRRVKTWRADHHRI